MVSKEVDNLNHEEGESLVEASEHNRSPAVVREEENREGKMKAACAPCLAANYDIGEDPSIWTRLRYSFLCPPHGWLAAWLTYALLVITLWAAAYVMFGRIALPGPGTVQTEVRQGAFLSVLVVVTLCLLGGWIVSLVGHYISCTKVRSCYVVRYLIRYPTT